MYVTFLLVLTKYFASIFKDLDSLVMHYTWPLQNVRSQLLKLQTRSVLFLPPYKLKHTLEVYFTMTEFVVDVNPLAFSSVENIRCSECPWFSSGAGPHVLLASLPLSNQFVILIWWHVPVNLAVYDVHIFMKSAFIVINYRAQICSIQIP
jgi:hypothetical protein